jgi:hypothetical protein
MSLCEVKWRKRVEGWIPRSFKKFRGKSRVRVLDKGPRSKIDSEHKGLRTLEDVKLPVLTRET